MILKDFNVNMGDGFINLLDLIYPIGSIYYSYSSTSPATIFGGTWVQIKDTFLRPAESAGVAGGSNSIILSVNNLPAHNHKTSSHRHALAGENSATTSTGKHGHALGVWSTNGTLNWLATYAISAPTLATTNWHAVFDTMKSIANSFPTETGIRHSLSAHTNGEHTHELSGYSGYSGDLTSQNTGGGRCCQYSSLLYNLLLLEKNRLNHFLLEVI